MLLLWILLWILLVHPPLFTSVSIESDGGYTNVVVGIHPQIQESEIDRVLSNLKDLFESASKHLKEATKGSVYFKEVIFALPKNYQNTLKLIKPDDEQNNEYFRNPDVLLTSNDVFQRAYAIQNEGCGKPSLRIHIPDQSLEESSSNRGKDFVRAWAKYRYGVFDESGFVGDDLYPACYTMPGTNVTKVTDCTNKRGSYDLREINLGNSKQCYPTPKNGRNIDITSSLMTNMDFPNIKFFCGDTLTHNKDVPSKQNALCNEQSTWKIISQHRDFLHLRKSSSVKDTKFKYVIESEYKLILAVSSSREIESYDRLDMTRNAFAYFLLNNLPENSKVGVITLKNTDENSVEISIKTSADAEKLIDMFPEADADNVCVHCGLEKAIKMLKKDSVVPQGDIVIVTEKDIEKNLFQEFTDTFIKLHVLYFQRRIKKPPLLQELAEKTGGKFFFIPENYKSGSSVSTLTQIYESFRTLQESFSWLNTNHVLVHQDTFFPNDCSTCSMNFYTDESIESMQVMLTGPAFLKSPPVIKTKIVLSNSEQIFSMGNSSFSYKIKIPAYTFTIRDPQPGKWTFSFQKRAESTNPVVVIVRGSSSRFNDIINVKTWLKNDISGKESESKLPSIALYAEVKKGNFAVNNTTATAILYEVESGKQLSLPLLDSGEGDPDITKKDGIFSRYFINAPKEGYYILTMKVEASSNLTETKKLVHDYKQNYCCGSSYPSTAQYDSHHMTRFVTYGSFYVDGRSVDLVLPPRKVYDLRFEKLVHLENGITCYAFKWTAPGDNYDYETAKEYQLKVFKNKEDAQKNFDSAHIFKITEWNIHGSILTPHTPGTLESAVVELRNLTTGTYYLGLRTVGFSGKTSEVSNIIEIYYTVPTISPFLSTSTDGTKTGMPLIEDSEKVDPILPLTITTVILLILIFIGLGILFYSRAKRKKEESSEIGTCNPKTESNDALSNSKDEINISVISPVNSWPANSLLSHYESQRSKKPDVCNVPMRYQDTDTISTVSSKYSYSAKYHTNPSFYESSYFPNPDKDDINYPFNPRYEQFQSTDTSSFRRFHPTDTSSLRRIHPQGAANAFSPTTISYSSSLDGRLGSRLRTDV